MNQATKTIVLIHGLWMTPRSWDLFREFYEMQGYRVFTPAWSRLHGEVEEVRHNPSALAGLGIEDAAIATVAAAEQGNPGIYLIADDRPLEVREWLSAFARWLNAPPPPQVSVEDALQIGGADAVYYGTQMRGASNAKAKHELNFQPRRLEWMVSTAVADAS